MLSLWERFRLFKPGCEKIAVPFHISFLLLIPSNLSCIKTSLTKNGQESSTCYANDSKSTPTSAEPSGVEEREGEGCSMARKQCAFILLEGSG